MSSSFLSKYSINREGYLTLGFVIFLSFIFFIFNTSLGVLGIFCAILVIYFFRDPRRVVPLDDNIILSPADGVVCNIEIAKPPHTIYTDDDMLKVSIFLSPLDVHVNRVPVNGIVKKLHYTPGKCLRADYDKSEGENERQEILIESDVNDCKKSIIVTQQTGFLTRRIVCNLNDGQNIKAGERFGIIKFGSRVTIYLPKDTDLFVSKGQSVIGAETIIASFENSLRPIKDTRID